MWIPSCLYSGNPYACGLYIETGPWSFRSGVSNLPLLGYAGLTACHLLSPWKVLVSDSVQRWGPLPHARCLPAHPQGVPHAPLMTQQRKWRENAASRADSETGVSPVCSPSGNKQVTYLTPRLGPLGTKYKPSRLRLCKIVDWKVWLQCPVWTAAADALGARIFHEVHVVPWFEVEGCNWDLFSVCWLRNPGGITPVDTIIRQTLLDPVVWFCFLLWKMSM